MGEGEKFKDVDHVEEQVTCHLKMMFDPNVEGKQRNVEHIDFDYIIANNLDRGLYF